MGIYDRTMRLEVALNNMDKISISENNKCKIRDFLNFLSANGISDSRQLKYIYPLEKIAIWLKKDYQDANRSDIEQLCRLIEKEKSYSNWTKQDYKIAIKKFYTWLFNKENPDIDEWETPKLVKFIKIKKPLENNKVPSDLITPKDVKFLAEHTRNLREKALILTTYESGARIGEILNLKIKDVTFDEYGAQLNLFGKTGYRKVRIIGSAPAISQWIQNEHPNKKDKNSYLFCYVTGTKKGNQMAYHMAAKIFRELKKRSGFDKPINPHHFRHSRASELAEYLTDSMRCNFFGWVQGSQMSRIYTHIQDTDRVILELNGLLEKKKDESGQFTEVEQYDPSLHQPDIPPGWLKSNTFNNLFNYFKGLEDEIKKLGFEDNKELCEELLQLAIAFDGPAQNNHS